MALLKLYEAANATVLYGTDTFLTLSSYHMQYSPRYDCAIYVPSSTLQSLYKVFRDGTAVRIHRSNLGGNLGYETETDRFYSIDVSGALGGNRYIDPVALLVDRTRPAFVTSTGFTNRQIDAVVWRNEYYNIGGSTVYVYSPTAVLQRSFTLTGTLSGFVGDRVFISPTGKLIAVDVNNTTIGRGHVRFYDLTLGQNLYESTFDVAKVVFVDTKHENLWSINNSTGKMQTWSFRVAPANFTAITMGSNKSRYREDALSVTLRGSDNEPAPYWVVKWSLSTSEGHLVETYTETGLDGVVTNTYCGPGAADFVGGSQTITVETGY